jgi:hypothetical protein
VVWPAEAAGAEDLLPEQLREALSELGDLAPQPLVVGLGVGEVGQQRLAAHGRVARASRRPVGPWPRRWDLGAEVVVSVEEQAVDPGRAGGRSDADLVAGGGQPVERNLDALAAAGLDPPPSGSKRLGAVGQPWRPNRPRS